MPNRFIKESIRGSDDLAKVSAEAERLFWRLVVSVDDFGRFDARPNIIIGQCMTSFLKVTTEEQVETWLSELAQVRLVTLYVVEGRPYLVLTKWDKHQRRRAKDSKFPSPEGGCEHPLSNVSNGNHPQSDADKSNQMHALYVFESVSENESENDSDSDKETIKKKKELPPSQNESDLDLDGYCKEVEYQMVACGASPNYTAKGEAYKWIRTFHESRVPISFVRSVIVQAYDKNPEISTFTYCAKIIKDLWQREIDKGKPVDILTMVTTRHNEQKVDSEFLEKFKVD